MKDATDITVILDRSGSMDMIKADTIGGFNQSLAEQQKEPGECSLTLIQFDTQNAQEYVCNAVPIADVKPLTELTFVPRAGTPLYDALGQAIVRTGERYAAMPEDQRPEKVLFIIITDGEENSSKEYDRAKVFAMVGEQEKTYGWHFIYIGANQDAMAVGASVGVRAMASMTYAPTPDAIHATYTSLSANVKSARIGARAQMGANLGWTDEQRKRARGSGSGSSNRPKGQ